MKYKKYEGSYWWLWCHPRCYRCLFERPYYPRSWIK